MKSLLNFTLCCFAAVGIVQGQNTDRVQYDDVAVGYYDERMGAAHNDPVDDKKPAPLFDLRRNVNFLSQMGYSVVTRQNGLQGFYTDGSLAFVADANRAGLNGSFVGLYAWGATRDEGLFNNNKPHGIWRGYYPNGTLRFVREYNADKIEAAIAEAYRANPKTSFYLHTNTGDSPNQVFSSLTSSAASFAHLPAGSEAYRPPFEQCLHHGMYINYFSNGQTKDSGYYKNGRRQGYWTEWYSTGQMKQTGIYDKGEKHSSWKIYNEQGILVQLEEYKHGKHVFTRKF
jgi:antitoxin component YwqK of YwqJK toxin-antitoxin module